MAWFAAPAESSRPLLPVAKSLTGVRFPVCQHWRICGRRGAVWAVRSLRHRCVCRCFVAADLSVKLTISCAYLLYT